MTRQAVRHGFEQFVGDAIEQTGEEFRIAGVLGGDGGGMIEKFLDGTDDLHAMLVEPELETFRDATIQQFEFVLDYVDSDEPIEAYRDEILTAGPFLSDLRDDLPPDREQEVRARLLERQERLASAVEPLVESEESEFWAAARRELSAAEAKELVEDNFAFTGPLREYRSAFAMTMTFDPEEVMSGLGGLLGTSAMEVDYTEEALRAMVRAERAVIADTLDEIDRRFD